MDVAMSPAHRGWTYLQERFPLGAHGPLVVAFAGGVACASAALRGAEGPGWAAVAVAVLVALGLFFQLRVADEWKDLEADRLYQPERPVPRGLVTLRELVVVALAVAVVQVALSVWLAPPLVAVLLGVWAFGAAMTVEFGAREWLRARPFATLVTHAPIVPCIDAFAVSCDVLGNGGGLPDGVGWLIGVSLFGGSVVELGRKIRQPADEREGVETYSAAWGRGRAVALFLLVLALSLGCGVMVVRSIGGVEVLVGALLAGAGLVASITLLAVRDETAGRGRWIEAASGIWTLALYTTIGPVALWML